MHKLLIGLPALAVVIVLFFHTAYAQEGSYILDDGDKVRISVFPGDIPEVVSRISDGGIISFPTLGKVKIGGMSARQAETLLRDVLEKALIIESPQVVVIVEERVSHQVSVLGKVENPGKYTILPGDSAIDLVAQAGGVTNEGSDTMVITRKNGKNVTVDLADILRNGKSPSELLLKDDDTIYIPAREVFYIYGEVDKPGSYPLQKSMTVMHAISVSGGITPRGTDRGIKIQRKNADGVSTKTNAELLELVEADDVIFVKESLF